MPTVKTLSLKDILRCARQAWQLIAAHPYRWLGISILFLLCAESLMLIPYIGFTLKLPVAAILSAQFLRLHMASEHGQAPKILGMFGGFKLAFPNLLLLVMSSLLVFACGIAVLYLAGGWHAARFFFGSFHQYAAPREIEFMQFKLAMYLVGAIFTFLPASIMLTRLSARAALRLSLRSFLANPAVILLMLSLGLLIEALSIGLPQLMGKSALLVVFPLILLLTMWLPAFRYATGKLAYS
ncbi:hypothetical protein ACO0LF_09285 [Undibacterium sp. Di27W]|uniref:hypothetical protein n=1 Tax=Undibacterium sp. Di27W TaxID=3413036 RepID=UPI003BF3CE82